VPGILWALKLTQEEFMGRPRSTDPELRHGRHCVFLMHVHLVFVTKYRRGVFTKEVIDDLRVLFAGVCRDFEAELVEFRRQGRPCAFAR
jgi:hypothetical protein